MPPASGAQVQRGSTHGSEIQYVFNTMTGTQTWTDGDRRLGQIMASYWINFATNGEPNGDDLWTGDPLPAWPAYYGSDEFQTMEFGDRIGTNPTWYLAPEKLELYNRIYASDVLGN